MTAPVRKADEHLDDGDLLSLIDGEAGDDRAAFEAHVAACAACTARLHALRARLGALSSALDDDEFVAVPPALTWDAVQRRAAERARSRAWYARPAWRAAAAVLVAAAGVAAAAPTIARWSRAHAAHTARTVDVPVARAAPAAAPATISVGGTATGALAVEFAARPSAGTLEIVADTGSTFAVQVRGAGPDDARIDVLPGRLVVLNTRTSAADYQLRVPRALHTLTVRVGDAAPVVTSGAALAARPRTLDLSRPEATPPR